MSRNNREIREHLPIYDTQEINLIFQHSFQLSRGSQDLQSALFEYMSVMYPKRRFPTGEENPRLFEQVVSHVGKVMKAMTKRGAHVAKTDQ